MVQEVNLPSNSGFMAISPPMPQGPYAVRKVVRGPDGLPRTVIVDPATGQTLGSTEGYSLLEGGNYSPAPAAGGTPEPEEPKQRTAEEILEPRRAEGGRDSNPGGQGTRGELDNFGYIDKPGWMGVTSMLPGAMGMVGKAVNMGINTNNMMARKEARSMMGLDNPASQMLGGVMKDNKGQWADVDINGTKYSVGAEALSPQGRTNLTPREANLRAVANKTKVNEIAKRPGEDDKKTLIEHALSAFFGPKENVTSPEEAARQKDRGLIGKAKTAVTDFMDSLFGNDEEQDRNYYPDAPTTSNTSHSQTGANQTRGIQNAVGGVSSIDNSPDDRDQRSRERSEAAQGGGGVTSGGTGLW